MSHQWETVAGRVLGSSLHDLSGHRQYANTVKPLTCLMIDELNWSRVVNFPGSISSVPDAPGVYAFGKVAKVLGLPSSIEWVYVGESRNLRLRLANHRAIEEANELLAAWLRSNKSGIEVWYATTELKERKTVERRLIREVAPVFNKIKYRIGGN
ncbi:hypothetical protein [Mycobacterium neumannii]|uniref:hypothetical protein n=1 Tax=Mycobacterium neumannii TaxID=2048551 RepID=UPI003AB70793